VIVLDTNVISELMRSQPHPAVVRWVAARPRGTLYTTSITEAELFYGIQALPEGRRRQDLAMAAEALFAEEFAGRVLTFGGLAARRYVEIVLARRREGQPIEGFDALIAAMAAVAGAAIATRDIGGFSGCGITVINPWEHDPNG
jgi:predicted nucleic acid-binding protein